MLNVLTVDVEDWFHVQAFSNEFPVSEWKSQRPRLLGNVIKTLEILDEYDTLATFFILGWVAENVPEVVELIHERGHEIASHSQYHRLVHCLDREEFKQDLQQSILHIEQCVDVTVKGYRAPSFSIRPDESWVWEVFAECGIEYDSSVFPIKHDTYGAPSAPRFAYRVNPAENIWVLEIPPSTVRLFGVNLPVGGGGYLRMFPYWLTQRSIRKINSEGHPAVVYFHPWELDPDQERVAAGFKSRFRHYTNLKTFEMKLRRLIAEFRFSSISEVFQGSMNRTPA
jgi:polysaccharide deacetylase family protein (PEP-CTERM system associated)